MNHDEAQEMLAMLAAGAVDEAEAAEALAHAGTCSECGPLAVDYNDAAAALVFALEPVAPAGDLRARILSAAREDAGSQTVAPAPVSIERERERRSGLQRVYQWAMPAVAAAALAAVVVLAVDNSNLRGDEDNFSTGEFTSESGARGTFIVDEDEDLVYVRFEDMPEVQEGQVFQIWVIEGEGAPIPQPTFTADPSGAAAVSFPSDIDFDALAVSVEPVGGSQAPTTTPFIIISPS